MSDHPDYLDVIRCRSGSYQDDAFGVRRLEVTQDGRTVTIAVSTKVLRDGVGTVYETERLLQMSPPVARILAAGLIGEAVEIETDNDRYLSRQNDIAQSPRRSA